MTNKSWLARLFRLMGPADARNEKTTSSEASRQLLASLLNMAWFVEASREVPKSSVLNWLSHNKQEGSSDYRKSGRDCGIYGVEETTFAWALREPAK